MNRTLSVVAVLLVVAGLLSGGIPTGGFEQVSADRQVSVDVADEASAYFAVSDAYDGRTVLNYFCFTFGGNRYCFQYDRPVPVADLENRFVQDYTSVDAAVVGVENTPDDTLEVRNAPAQLSEGSSAEIELGCTGDRTASGQGDVTVALGVSGPSVDIDTEATVEDVQYQCATTS